MELLLTSEKSLYLQPTEEKTNYFDELGTILPTNLPKGLLHLLQLGDHPMLTNSLRFWREFTGLFFKSFCTFADHGVDSIPADVESLKSLILTAPPIKGNENLDIQLLESMWENLSNFIFQDLSRFKYTPRQYLEEYFPAWAQVGRIYFHLAENLPTNPHPFAFLATYSTRISNKTRVQHTPLAIVFKDSWDNPDKSQLKVLLKPLQIAAENSPFVEDLLSSKRLFSPLHFSSEDAFLFLQDFQAMEDAGIIVKFPKSWNEKAPVRAKVQVQIKEEKKSFVGFNQLLKFTPTVVIDGEALTKEEIEALLKQNQKLIKIRGKWVEVDQVKISHLLNKWEKATEMQKSGFTFAQAMRLLSSTKISEVDANAAPTEEEQGWIDFTASESLREKISSLLSPSEKFPSELESILSSKLLAQPRPYQFSGIRWLHFLSAFSLGGCLADDMGLGKTLQMISLLLFEVHHSQNTLPSLLILPASLLGNWEQELNKFAPSIHYRILHSSQGYFTDQALPNLHLVITTYSIALRTDWLRVQSWNLLILDEAQAIKNPQAKQTQAIKEIQARVKIAMTGTPIENTLADLWSIFDFCCPDLLGKQKQFASMQKSLQEIGDYTPIRKLIQPYLLRRKKTDKSIISDLPDKTELQSYCLLTEKQIELYTQAVDELAKLLNDDEKTEIQRKGMILSYLLKFKQICNHPSQYLGDHDYDYTLSGKFFRLREITETIAARGEKVLIFTQFRELTDILEGFLAEIFGARGLVLHGGTPVDKRKSLVNTFQSNEKFPFFILSLKAGGVGLNLTRASHVIHFDRWWNPAVENQATDRAFRIGQKRNVLVHKFVCQGTIEEKIDQMIASKVALSNDILESSEELKFTEMSNQEIMEMVAFNPEQKIP